MLAAAAAWSQLAAELESAAIGCSSVVSGLTGPAWSGPTSAGMQAATASYVGWLHKAAARAEQTAAQACSAAAAFEVAFAIMVPPSVIAANRALLAALIATNIFGQNSAAIAATEAHYAEMWGQDATAMTLYACSSSAASVLDPFQEPTRVTDPVGLTAQSGAMAQATAGTSGAQVLAQAAAAAPLAPAMTPDSVPLFSSTPLFTSTSIVGTAGLFPSFLGQDMPTYPMAGVSYGLIAPSSQIAFGTKVAGVYADAARAADAQARFAERRAVELGSGRPVSARLGRAGAVAALSVPPNWANEPVAIAPAASALPLTGAAAGSAFGPVTQTPASMFSQSLMSALSPGIGGPAQPKSKPVLVRNPASEHADTTKVQV